MSLDVKHIFFRAAQQWKFKMNFSVQSRAYLTFLHVTLDKADRHLEECEWRGFISIMSTGFRSVAPAVYQSFPQAVSYLPYLISPTPHVLCPGGTRSSVGSAQTKRTHTGILAGVRAEIAIDMLLFSIKTSKLLWIKS